MSASNREEQLASTSTPKISRKKRPHPEQEGYDSVPGLVMKPSGEVEFIVEKIMDKWVRSGRVYYFVKWVGWDSSENTWEPKAHLKNCLDLVDEYERQQKQISSTEVLEVEETLNPTSKEEPKPCSSCSLLDHKRHQGSSSGVSLNPGKLKKRKERESSSERDPEDGLDHSRFDEDERILGPLFCRTLEPQQIPVCILGYTVNQGCLLYLVKIKEKTNRGPGQGSRSSQTWRAHRLDNLTKTNVVIMLASTLNKLCPQLVIKFHEEGVRLLPPVSEVITEKVDVLEKEKEADDVPSKARTKALIIEMGRKHGVIIDPKKNFQGW